MKKIDFYRENIFLIVENLCSIKMDHWICYFSSYFNHPWVKIPTFSFHSINSFVLRIFIPQIVTLPTDNSTSEWNEVKYLINHFDSSSNYFLLFSIRPKEYFRITRFHIIYNFYYKYYWISSFNDLYGN
jgi:hypothetical protein